MVDGLYIWRNILINIEQQMQNRKKALEKSMLLETFQSAKMELDLKCYVDSSIKGRFLHSWFIHSSVSKHSWTQRVYCCKRRENSKPFRMVNFEVLRILFFFKSFGYSLFISLKKTQISFQNLENRIFCKMMAVWSYE